MAARVHLDPSGFAITFPATWQVRTDVAGLAVMALLPYQVDTRDNIGVIVEETGRPGLTVQQYLSSAVVLAPGQVDDFDVAARGERRVGQRVQGVLEYTGSAAGAARRFVAVVVVRRGRAFTATFTATASTFRAHLLVAAPVLDSLHAQ